MFLLGPTQSSSILYICVNKNAESPDERKWSFVLSSMDGQSGGLYTPRWQPCCLFRCLLRRDLSHRTSHCTSHARLAYVSRTFRLSHTCLTLTCGSAVDRCTPISNPRL